jgi:hypothetical protein
MALSAALEDLLKELEKSDPAAAKTQRSLLEGNEKVAKAIEPYVLRQADYDRFMNENKGKLSTFEAREKWFKDNEPKHKQALADLKAANEKLADMEKQLKTSSAAAAAAVAAEGGVDVDPAKIVEAVKAALGNDVPTKADLDKLIGEKTVELVKANYTEAVNKFYTEEFPRAAQWSAAMTDAQIQYFQETGKRMDRKEFAKFMSDNKIADPGDGYEKFMEPVRRQQQVEAEVKKGVEAELAKRNSSGDFPGSSGAPQPMGALQIRLAKRAEGDPLIPKDAELGDSSLAHLAAQELRNEGKVQ